MCGFFFAIDDSASWSCFGFRQGHSSSMAEVALVVLCGTMDGGDVDIG
jgi:hypothetical protein